MDNLEGLLEMYQNSGTTRDILNGLQKEGASRLLLSGMTGALECFVLTAVFKEHHVPHVFIAEDKEEAAYIQNTIDQFIPNQTVLFFPDSFKHPGSFEEIDINNVLIRTEAINKIYTAYNKKDLLITYPEALFEKVIDPTHLDKQKITIKKEEDLDQETLLEFLIEYGFERTDFVYEPGQFSIRGGIIDIFSFGNEWPYRVELFDEEVESIRLFNPNTQLSLKNIERVSIIPNISNRFGQEHKISLFEVFNKETVLWIKDVNHLVEKLAICENKARSFAEHIKNSDDEKLKTLLDERAFILPDTIISEFESRNI
ncbi:MAG: transcription-repair coupling factor, partial [Bacteroidia bacterium]|nr:transcription-repair coupling factor [Bacteroidia bacterium]